MSTFRSRARPASSAPLGQISFGCLSVPLLEIPCAVPPNARSDWDLALGNLRLGLPVLSVELCSHLFYFQAICLDSRSPDPTSNPSFLLCSDAQLRKVPATRDYKLLVPLLFPCSRKISTIFIWMWEWDEHSFPIISYSLSGKSIYCYLHNSSHIIQHCSPLARSGGEHSALLFTGPSATSFPCVTSACIVTYILTVSPVSGQFSSLTVYVEAVKDQGEEGEGDRGWSGG